MPDTEPQTRRELESQVPDVEYHRGILRALELLADRDAEDLYRALVSLVETKHLLTLAAYDGSIGISGLRKYGYA